jgi:hypothetical protein
MRRPAWRCGAIAFAVVALHCNASLAIAEPYGPPNDVTTDAPGTKPEAPPSEQKKKKVDWLFAPVPFSSPTTGTGIAAGAVAFYNPNQGPHQWITGGGGAWTDNGTKGVLIFHTMYLDGDRFRVTANASYIDNHTAYFGIGAEDGDRGDPLVLKNAQTSINVQGLIRAFPHGYVGLRYRLATYDVKPDDKPSTTPLPPADQLHSTLSTIGPAITYDTRDSTDLPHRGVYITANILFGFNAIGDSFRHNKLNINGSMFFPFGEDTVLGINAALCSAGGDVPYYDECLFGSGAQLRGYLSGRYRDHAAWALQDEVRHQFSRRWGGIFFFGIGGIAPSVGDIVSKGNVLPAAGIGARYRPFKDNDINLRLDFAIGKNDNGVYLGIGEAF